MADEFSGIETSIVACYSTWADDYYETYYGAAAAYPPVHADLVRDLLVRAGVKSVLDAGCGPASFLRHMGSTTIRWSGFDVTPEMVARAQQVAKELGRADAEIWVGSVLDDSAFVSPGREPFDAAVMIGVLPHVPAEADEAVLRRLSGAVVPGGLLITEARNALFGLFTLNRPSFELFAERLIRWQELEALASPKEAATLRGLKEALAGRFRMDLPPMRAGKADEPGYDQVLSRTHVPFELQEAARRAGWRDVETLYVHFHVLPPMFERAVPDLFRRASMGLEDPRDWRGVVMASSFLLTGRRA